MSELKSKVDAKKMLDELLKATSSCYWCFGKEQRYMAVKCDEGMKIRTITKKDQKKQEHKLSKEMFLSFKKRAWIFLAVRKVYFMMRPIMKQNRTGFPRSPLPSDWIHETWSHNSYHQQPE